MYAHANEDHRPPHPARRARFWSRIVEHRGCLAWTGAISDDGYGQFWYTKNRKQRVVRAHRFAWECENEDAAADKYMTLMHQCNNTLCVRIDNDHVTPGTQQENFRYADALGRRNGCKPMRGAAIATDARNLRAQLLGWPQDIDANDGCQSDVDLRLF